MKPRIRVLDYVVPEEDAGRRIDHFLRRQGLTGHTLVELKKWPEGVLLNGSPVYMVERLQPGDHLQLQIIEALSSPHIVPSDMPLDIRYEDDDIMVIHKPAGVPTHPSMNHYENTLANGLTAYFAAREEPFVFRCCNRLDRDTSGLTLIAKHYAASGILSEMAARKEIMRRYLAIVRGRPDPPEGVIDVPLGRKPGSIIERMIDPEHGEQAVTHYRCLYSSNGHTLVELRLETGRTHQIRIHLQYLGYPLIGDYLYNPDYEWIGRQALHSCSLDFRHPMTGEPMHFEASMPPDMVHVLFPLGDGPQSNDYSEIQI